MMDFAELIARFTDESVLMVLGIGLFGLLLVLMASMIGQRRRHAVLENLGFDADVVYADRGRGTTSFVSKTYGIVAKPDFVLRFDSGEYAVVEYKSRSNGRLYDSDVAQVKASVIAAREQFNVTQAFVIVGTERYTVEVDRSSDKLYREIEILANHARAANAGDDIMVFAKSEAMCRSCAVRRDCQRKNTPSSAIQVPF